jgi:hypothetical protein
MPPSARPRHDPTDDWIQIRLLAASPEQKTYKLLRPIVSFGQPLATRARETGVPERTLRRKAAHFDAHGMRSLFEFEPLPATDRRRLPPEVRRAILELKAEYPAFALREIARICRERFDRPVSHHAVVRVLDRESLPILPPRRFRRYREIADPVRWRKAVVDLDQEGRHPTSIAGNLKPRAGALGSGRLAGVGQSPPGTASAGAPGRPEGDGRDPPLASEPRTGRISGPRGHGATWSEGPRSKFGGDGLLRPRASVLGSALGAMGTAESVASRGRRRHPASGRRDHCSTQGGKNGGFRKRSELRII